MPGKSAGVLRHGVYCCGGNLSFIDFIHRYDCLRRKGMPHPFNFSGGKELSKMGASWFVSYCYDNLVPGSSNNWSLVKTAPSRSSVYHKTEFWATDGNVVFRCKTQAELNALMVANPLIERLFRFWMRQIINSMKSKKINQNSIGLNYTLVRRYALICLPLL